MLGECFHKEKNSKNNLCWDCLGFFVFFFFQAIVQKKQNFIIKPCKLLGSMCAAGTHNIWDTLIRF